MEGADLEATRTFYTYGVTLKLPAAACNVESLLNRLFYFLGVCCVHLTCINSSARSLIQSPSTGQ